MNSIGKEELPSTPVSELAPKLLRRDSAMLAILAVAAAARIWGIDFCLPEIRCRPDEAYLVDIALGMLHRGPDPEFFHYPSLMFYVLALLYGGFLLVGRWTGKFDSLPDFVAAMEIDPTPLYWIARTLSALLAVATVWLVARIASSVLGQRAGPVAAFFLALAYLHARDSHFATTDVPTTFFLIAATRYLIELPRQPSLANYLGAGFFAGLATSAKYLGVLMAPPLLATHWLTVVPQRMGQSLVWKLPSRIWSWTRHLFFDPRLFGFAGALVLAFIATTPFAIFNFQQFQGDLTTRAAHQTGGHAGMEIGGLAHHLEFTLRFGLGLPLLAAALLGLILLCKKDPRRAFPLVSFPILLYYIVSRQNNGFTRYMVPIVPYLCVTAAAFTLTVTDWIGGRFGCRARGWATAAVCVLLIAPSATRLARFDHLLTREDTRLEARRWIFANIPQEAFICMAGLPWAYPRLPEAISSLEREWRRLNRNQEDLDARGQRARRFRLQVLAARIARQRSEGPPGYEIATAKRSGGGLHMKRRRVDPIPYCMMAESSLRYYSRPSPVVKANILQNFKLIRRFVSSETLPDPKLFDRQDAFFLPFADLRGVERPGANLLFYERNEDPPPEAGTDSR